MPNWCENELVVTGPAEAVRRFREQARSTGRTLSFAAFVPEPDYDDPALAGRDWWPPAGSLLPGWYAWRLVHWGPKWDVNESSVRVAEGDRRLVYGFATPYGPPLPWLTTVSAEFPELHFVIDYHELMLNFRGRQVFADGEWQDAQEGRYFDLCEWCGAEYALPFPDQPRPDEPLWCGQCVEGHDLFEPD
ncbi:hypothetical protein J0H58_16555 [bacterium]|nr:hypothetical protein [bacterium]